MGKTAHDQLTLAQSAPLFEELALKTMEDCRHNSQPLTVWDVFNLYMDFDIQAPAALKLSRSQYFELRDQMVALQSPVQPPTDDDDPNPVFQSEDLDFLNVPAIAVNLFPPEEPVVDATAPPLSSQAIVPSAVPKPKPKANPKPKPKAAAEAARFASAEAAQLALASDNS